MIPMGPRAAHPGWGLKDVTMIDCASCGRPTVFVREPQGRALCAGCAGTPTPERETPRTCPVDGGPLSVESRANVNIDRCPECGGVWLDSGELDLILGAASAAAKQSERVAALLVDVLTGSVKGGRGEG
jgi:NMD protein affecting ribosome stability and mRNA decay